MTLLLTATTPDHIVQVSDRRLSWPNGRLKDGFVKGIVTQAFACSYTGVAELGGDTAKWIARILATHAHDPDGGLDALRASATSALNKRRYAGMPLAIVVVGWVIAGPTILPRIRVISNFDVLKPLGGAVEQTFKLVHLHPSRPTRLSGVFSAGQLMSPHEMATLDRALERLCVSGRASARAVAQLLTEWIRGISRASQRAYDTRQPTVSEDVLIVSLPRPDRCRGGLLVGRLVDDWWSVTSVPAGESRQERPGGPIIVGPGAAMRALEPHEGPPGPSDLSGGAEVIMKGDGPGGGFTLYLLTNPPLGAAWGWPGTSPGDGVSAASTEAPGNPS
jgi:hypothetical protein